MEPLRRLTHKDSKTGKRVLFHWTSEHQDIKRHVTEAPILAYYNSEEDLQIQCAYQI